MNAPHFAPPPSEPLAPQPQPPPEATPEAQEVEAPEWIDVSPEVSPQPPTSEHAPLASRAASDEARGEEESQARWASRWSTWKWLLLVAAAIGVTRWVTWRQSVMYEPPIQVSALATPMPSAPIASPVAAASATPAPRRLQIHVVGLVKKPGVFEMPAGSRLNDALRQAGGVLPGADLEAINLAEPLEDGRQYRVAARQSAPNVAAPEPRRERQVLAAPGPSRPTPRRAATPRAASTKAPDAPIDLNRATLIELQELPGVGPATAQKIVEHRDEIGGFKSVDDLDGVKGIGPKKLEKIRPFARVQ